MKIIVSPSIQIARAHGYDYRNKEYVVITRKEQAIGMSRDISDYIFIEGEDFDYPPLTDEYFNVRTYIERCIVKREKQNES